MAKFLQNVSLISGQAKRNKFNLDGQTVTTTDFFRPIPVRTIPVFPNDSVSLKSEAMIRLQPLPVPTFGRVDATLRWFFVPYRSVFYAWNKFIERIPYKGSIVDSTPTITNDLLVKGFISDIGYSDPVGTIGKYAVKTYSAVGGGSINGNDFYLVRPNPVTPSDPQKDECFKFTARGRHLYNILCSLGYSLNFTLADVSTMSLLPLLCYLRVIVDYYSDPQVAQYFENYFDKTSYDEIDLSYMLNQITETNYDFDYFTSAWQSPVSPTNPSSDLDPLSITDITSVATGSSMTDTRVETIGNQQFQTPNIRGYQNGSNTATTIRNLSQYAIDSLRVMSNYLRRHNLVGWRLMDRFLSDFGKKLDYKVANQSIYLDSMKIPVQIGAIFSNSDTSPSGGRVLGSYAGQGLGFGDGTLKFDADDQHGMLICIASIVPKISYYQGRIKQQGVLATKPLDFLNGDFDQLGVQAIELQEVFADMKSEVEAAVNWNYSWTPRKVWGFTQRYQEWKTAYDTLSGDFRVNSLKAGADSYHLFRSIFPTGESYDITQLPYSNYTSISSLFRRGSQEQYDRIFTYQSTDADHFMMFANFDIEVWRNAAKLGDTLLDTHDNEQSDKVDVQRDGSLFN